MLSFLLECYSRQIADCVSEVFVVALAVAVHDHDLFVIQLVAVAVDLVVVFGRVVSSECVDATGDDDGLYRSSSL